MAHTFVPLEDVVNFVLRIFLAKSQQARNTTYAGEEVPALALGFRR